VSEHRAGLERFNVGADPPIIRGRPPLLAKHRGGSDPLIPNDLTQRSHRGIGDGMSTYGKLLQHGKPQRREARSQPDSREGQAGPPGVADRLVVPRKPGNSGGGKGPEFKEAARRGKGPGEWCKPMNLPIERSESEGGDPQNANVLRLCPVFPCPRAGCGKSARPGSMSGEWKRSVSHRATPRLYKPGCAEREVDGHN
jgi:hypothetical protein